MTILLKSYRLKNLGGQPHIEYIHLKFPIIQIFILFIEYFEQQC